MSFDLVVGAGRWGIWTSSVDITGMNTTPGTGGVVLAERGDKPLSVSELGGEFARDRGELTFFEVGFADPFFGGVDA